MGVASEVDGYINNDVGAIPKSSCVSPYRVSRPYEASGTDMLSVSGIFTTGVIARARLPKGVYGMQPAYRNPDKHGSVWSTGDMINASTTNTGESGVTATKLAIGGGAVQFAIRTIAPEGSAACATTPDVSFEHVGSDTYFAQQISLGWPQPVDVGVNGLGGIAHAVGDGVSAIF
jgi:hypothetical protein